MTLADGKVEAVDDIIQALANDPRYILALVLGPIAMVVGALIAWLGCRTAARNTREREHTRREIAAYIAEGSMSSEDGERLLSPAPWCAGTAKTMLKDAHVMGVAVGNA